MKQLFSVIVFIVLSAFAAGANLAAPLLDDLDVEYTYDRNGNMTSDANKGLEMSWDYNNRLYKVEDDEMTMTFNRTGSGQKLGKSVYVGPNLKDYLRPGVSRSNSLGGYPAFPRDSVLVYPTDSIFHIGNTTLTENFGSYEYVNGKFARLNTSTGYRDSEGTHVYVRDWQGNIRAVVRKGDDGSTVLEQATYYYPYGMPMAESTNPTANSYKYTGKELLTNKGFNCNDFGPRPYDPATCIWLRRDDLSHETPDFSHNAFCNGDPINFIDPSGYAVVYNRFGQYLGCSSEGFEGDIFIYSGNENINFGNYTQDELSAMTGDLSGLSYLDVERGQGALSNEAYSNIWTHIFNYFEGVSTNGVTFRPSSLTDNKIHFQRYDGENYKGAWSTCTFENNVFYRFIGTNTYSYESTIENIASSLIAHEWHSHYIEGTGDEKNNHSFAYFNTMNSVFWDKVTPSYKNFTLYFFSKFLFKELMREYGVDIKIND